MYIYIFCRYLGVARHPGADQLVGDVRHLPLCAVCARWFCVVVWVWVLTRRQVHVGNGERILKGEG